MVNSELRESLLIIELDGNHKLGLTDPQGRSAIRSLLYGQKCATRRKDRCKRDEQAGKAGRCKSAISSQRGEKVHSSTSVPVAGVLIFRMGRAVPHIRGDCR